MIPLQEDVVGGIRSKLMILLAAVAIVLIIASTNVSNLLLSRATTRRREMSLRAALGAGRSRIVRQLLTESVALAFLGAIVGILLGMSILSIFKAMLPSSTPGLADVTVNWRVVGGIVIVSFLNGIAFGLAPALNASQIDLADAMKTGSQRSTSGKWARFRKTLIATEVGMTLLLVVSAGLLLKSLYTLSSANPGFNPAHVLAVRVSPNQKFCESRTACVALYERLMNQARLISGVNATAISNSLPLDGQVPTIPVDVEGRPKTADHPAPMLWFGAVSSDYLRMLNVPLLAGRFLSRTDSAGGAGVVLISASTAKQFWPGESAIGKHLKPSGSHQWRTIVGVVGDVNQYMLSKALPSWVPGAVYMPYAQSESESGEIPAAMTLVIKSNSNSDKLRSRIQQLVQAENPNAPIGPVIQLKDLISNSISDFSSTIRVFLIFAGGAILMAALGIYGLMSYWVAQRTYEIGLRVAIGASRSRIVSMIVTQALTITIYGVTGGVVTALLVTRFLASLLYGVGATDAFTFAAVIALVLGVACLATVLPAWTATRIDPVKSLRAE